MRIPEIYTAQDSLTDPGKFAALYNDLPTAPARLRELVSQLIAHVSWASRYEIPANVPLPRDTQSVVDRLQGIQCLLPGPLVAERSPAHRTFGTCRDYSLVLCSMLRHHSVPARIRCGFATYFTGGPFEDHWICEFWSAGEQRWVRLDAQIDELQRDALGIRFECADLPPNAFLTAAEAWQRARSGVEPAEAFGHAEARGLWFIRVNVYRDLLALTNQYTSAWDTWRESPPETRDLDSAALATADGLAKAAHEFQRTSDKLDALRTLASRNAVPPWQSTSRPAT